MYNPIFDIEGKIAMVTGSARGLGLCYAEAYLAAGCTVILNDANKEGLEATVKKLQSEGKKVYGYHFDCSNEEEVRQAVDKIESEVGPIDILVNNAGIQRRHPMNEFPIEEWRQVVDINLTGVFIVGRCVGAKMCQRGHGKIINIASLNADLARANICAYSSAKGGVIMLTKSMATEYGAYGVNVNAVGPGYFDTDMTHSLVEDPDFDAWVKSEVPMKRWGLPSDLIGAIIYLSAPASDYVGGICIYVDGGWKCCL